GRTFNIGLLGSVAALGGIAAVTACSGAPGGSSSPSVGSEEPVASSSEALLTTACTYDTSGNITLKIMDGEVGYIAFQAGCTTEPCVIVNAVDSQNNVCKVASSGKSITVNGQGAGKVEKLVLDYTNGLFAKSTGTTLVTLNLDTTSGGDA